MSKANMTSAHRLALAELGRAARKVQLLERRRRQTKRVAARARPCDAPAQSFADQTKTP
jgi:hypothetical protein